MPSMNIRLDHYPPCEWVDCVRKWHSYPGGGVHIDEDGDIWRDEDVVESADS